jgi:hypothetical protein
VKGQFPRKNVFLAGERKPGRSPTLRLRGLTHATNRVEAGRAALKSYKGVSERTRGDRLNWHHAAAALLKVNPSSAAVARPVRMRHQSTRNRRASATAICLARLGLAPTSWPLAHTTPL